MDWQEGRVEFAAVMQRVESYYGSETADFFKAVFDKNTSEESRRQHLPTLLLMLAFSQGDVVEGVVITDD
jgi:hypothetical protein